MAEQFGVNPDPFLDRYKQLYPDQPNADFNTMTAVAFAQAKTLANAPPPAVAAVSVVGTSTDVARADHTHQSSVQRQNVPVPLVGTTGKGAITFAQPYAAGVTPVILTETETPDQTSYIYYSSVIPGTVTNTGFQVMVRKIFSSQTLPALAANLLNYVVNIFGLATGTVTVKYQSAVATA